MKQIKPEFLQELIRVVFVCPYCDVRQTHFRDVEEELSRFESFCCCDCLRVFEVEFEFVD